MAASAALRMTPGEYAQLKQLFDAALDRPADEREHFLRHHDGIPPALRDQALKLLAHHRASEGFLAPPPDRIAGYGLLELLGQGGMGRVYRARHLATESGPVVALKLIQPGPAARQLVARFRKERRALDQLDHPHIARLLDHGVSDQGPFFVMEFVPGVDLRAYCAAHPLTVHQRIALMLPVCHALQHAHERGILHRDLKPANILISDREDKPFAKVIDFGLAKHAQTAGASTPLTHPGMLLGTPAYMSPEQAGFGGLALDARADVYSLGAVLYELLTGCTPLDLDSAHPSELLWRIRDQNPPPPSLLAPLDPALDQILLRAIAKDREQRYPSAAALAHDLEAFLSGQPAPSSVRRRLRTLVGDYRRKLKSGSNR